MLLEQMVRRGLLVLLVLPVISALQVQLGLLARPAQQVLKVLRHL